MDMTRSVILYMLYDRYVYTRKHKLSQVLSQKHHAVHREFKNFNITAAVEDFIEDARACQKRKESPFIITIDRVSRYLVTASDNFVVSKIPNF